jgi:hypothetical protein
VVRQLHRLRFAIEVDCDARMLAQGHAWRLLPPCCAGTASITRLTGAAPIVLKDPRAAAAPAPAGGIPRDRAANLL